MYDTEIYTPIDGVVLVKSAEAGEVLAAGTTVVTVGDLDHPWLRAYINETDLGRVKLGQKVKLTTDSFPGKVTGEPFPSFRPKPSSRPSRSRPRKSA